MLNLFFRKSAPVDLLFDRNVIPVHVIDQLLAVAVRASRLSELKQLFPLNLE